MKTLNRFTDYERELQNLKDWDTVQYTTQTKYGEFITTAGHGYLIVPKYSKYYILALNICEYGFFGKIAVYLEEDCEVQEFINSVDKINN